MKKSCLHKRDGKFERRYKAVPLTFPKKVASGGVKTLASQRDPSVLPTVNRPSSVRFTDR